MSSKFWLEDPCMLVSNFIPNSNMTRTQKLNSLATMIIIVSAIMYLAGYQHWLIFLIGGLLITIFLQYGACNKSSESFTEEAESDNDNIEHFSLTPTYISVSNPNQTTVAPLFAEEWQIYPPAYDTTNEAPSEEPFDDVLVPQQYPYGQYLTKTNLLPSDEYYVRQMNGGTTQAREYVNSSFTRNTLAHRDNMMRLYRKQIARRFRQNYNDTVSPFTSY